MLGVGSGGVPTTEKLVCRLRLFMPSINLEHVKMNVGTF
jgi:hypothetical protein